jgi:peroxiredoxin
MSDIGKSASATRTLYTGLLSPFVSAGLGILTYGTLTRASVDRDADFMFRLGATAVAMAIPFLLTCAVALLDRKRGPLGMRGTAGLALALVSLGLTWFPIRGAMARAKQAELLSLRGVPAPHFETADIGGTTHRLSEHDGKVVLINIWATWCPPCRKEMPELDELYQTRRDRGFIVFGLSTEDLATQQNFAENTLSVSYPLLTLEGEVPEIYRTTARYPANFLIDRKGLLMPAPSTEQPFENLAAKVDELLAEEAQ